jgi:hypothetical protein
VVEFIVAHHALEACAVLNLALATFFRNIIIIIARPGNHNMFFALFDLSQKAPEFRSVCPRGLLRLYQFEQFLFVKS